MPCGKEKKEEKQIKKRTVNILGKTIEKYFDEFNQQPVKGNSKA